MRAPHHLWSTADGRLVETGHLDAETLAYPTGSDLPDDVARQLGLIADEPKRPKAASEGKQSAAATTKQRNAPTEK